MLANGDVRIHGNSLSEDSRQRAAVQENMFTCFQRVTLTIIGGWRTRLVHRKILRCPVTPLRHVAAGHPRQPFSLVIYLAASGDRRPRRA
jgi:hypothetical protein